MQIPPPPSLEHLNPRDAWAMSLHIRTRLGGVWNRLGLDSLGPFGGLEAAPQLLQLGSLIAMRRTLTGAVVRSWGAQSLRGIPVPAQWRPLRSAYVALTREEIDRAADRLHRWAVAWRAGRYLPPATDAALVHGRRLLEAHVRRCGPGDLFHTDGVGPAVDRALDDQSRLGRHLGVPAGVPATHSDFLLHRRMLMNAAWVGAHRAADEARAEIRAQRQAAARMHSPGGDLAAELFG